MAKKEQPEVKSGTSKPKPKHLVLDAVAQDLFNKALLITGADTEKQAIQEILSKYCETSGVNELNDYHNSDDVAEIERLTKLTCDKVNCELNAELTQVNSDLTAKNDELTQVNFELTDKLNKLQLEVNSAGEKLTAKELELESTGKRVNLLRETFGSRNWELLHQCIEVFNRERNTAATPEQYLMSLFEHYQVLQNNYTLHDPLSRSTIRETIKKYIDGSK